VGDIIIADLTIRDGNNIIGNLKEASLDVERQLAFKDGLVRNFSEKVKGVKAGDTRTVDVELSSGAASEMGGKTVTATLEVKDIKTLRLPDLTPEYLGQFGLMTPEQLDESLKAMLERQLEHNQRRLARIQVLEQISAASSWELPRELLQRQARRALNRRIMEMKQDGFNDQEIARQQRLLEQDILKTTEMTLKEHFVLQKIAEVEKIEVDEDDLNDEIERLADQTDESPRRLRARLEKEDMLESLMAEMVERRALDLILDSAEYDDYPLDPQEATAEQMATVEAQAVPGEMKDMTAAPPESEEPAKSETSQEGQ